MAETETSKSKKGGATKKSATATTKKSTAKGTTTTRKSPAKKTAVPAAPAEAVPAAEAMMETAAPAAQPAPVDPEMRQRMIAEAAYWRAESRGFAGGDPVEDWLAAEQQIATMLGERE